MNSKKPLVSVVVPTFNSEKKIYNFLSSCIRSTCTDFEIVINDSKKSTDNIPSLIEKFEDQLNIVYIKENTSMAQGRVSGAKIAKGDILLHLDSDMEITPLLINECVELINSGFDALVIPEESFGTTFWAECKNLEKKMYEGVEQIESLRCIKTAVYKKVGGHDSDLVFSEDKDLDIRVWKAGFKIGRTVATLLHNEGDLKLTDTLKKKTSYSLTANLFAEKHPEHYAWQANPFNRYIIFLKNYTYFFKNPILYVGLFFLKTVEYGGVAFGILSRKSDN